MIVRHPAAPRRRQQQIMELRKKGLPYQAIATLFGVSRQRIHQIASGYDVLNASGHHKRGWYSRIRTQVLERANHKCQRCGKPSLLIIHHLDRDDINNNLANLIALCRKCHQQIHKLGTRTKAVDPELCMVSFRLMNKKYTMKQKRDRNRRLVKFWRSHSDWPMRSIGKIFGISHVRVIQILKREKMKNDVSDSKTGTSKNESAGRDYPGSQR